MGEAGACSTRKARQGLGLLHWHDGAQLRYDVKTRTLPNSTVYFEIIHAIYLQLPELSTLPGIEEDRTAAK
jgi:hypothetical protein